QTRRSLWEYAQSLRESEGVTIFLTTHYMDEAEACDRIAIIDHGQIIALDTPSGLKARLGGDVVTVSAHDNGVLEQELRDRFSLEPRVEGEGLEFRVERGDVFVPQLFTHMTTQIETVSIRRPTLDDVFVSMTGHQIRESAAGEADMLRSAMRGPMAARMGIRRGGGGH